MPCVPRLTYLIHIRGGRPDGYKMQQQRKSAICLVRRCQRDIGVVTLDILDSISWSDLLDLRSALQLDMVKYIYMICGNCTYIAANCGYDWLTMAHNFI